MTTIDKIRAEIERLRETNPPEYNFQNAEGYCWALDDILSFLNTLQEPEEKDDMDYCKTYCRGFRETGGLCFFGGSCDAKRKAMQEPKFSGTVDAGIPGKDYIPVSWVDACEKYGKWKIVPINQEPEVDLEEECTRFYRTDEYKTAQTYGRGFETIARHFYELGKKAK